MKKLAHALRAAVIGLAFAAAAAPASAATAVFDQYTVDYDDSTTFGGISFSGGGGGGLVFFGWNFSPLVTVSSNAAGVVNAPFDLPSFTVTANPGWVLSGAVSGLVGNLVYFELGGGTTAAATSGSLSFDGGAPSSIGGALDKTPTAAFSGYLSGTGTVSHGAFSSMVHSGGVLSLSATAGPGAFAAITAQPQNILQISFTAAPIPEPESYIMLLAGLGMIGMMVRRRMPQRR